MGSQIRSDIIEEAARLADAAVAAGAPVRAIGGVAVRLHASVGVHPALARSYRDIDLVTTSKGGKETGRFLASLGYEPNERFNAMNGSTRLVFYDVDNGRQVDVFVGEFRMCHRVPVADRLQLDQKTVPLAELLLTKLQIVHLNEKDLRDIFAVVLEHEIAEHDEEAINAAYVAALLAADWGFWRTARQTIEEARARLGDYALAPEECARVDVRLARLWERVEAEPKSLRWRSRAKIGERTRWYEEQEEIEHRAG